MQVMIYQENGTSIIIFDIDKGYLIKPESLVGKTIKMVKVDTQSGSLILELD